MNSWPPNSRHQHVGKKLVPDGSNEFQRVLDQIFCSDDSSNASQARDIIVSHHISYKNEDDTNGSTPNLDEPYMTSDNNNNRSEGVSDKKCASRQCQQDQSICGNDYIRSVTNIINDCYENNLPTNHSEHTPIHICSIQESEQVLEMGASCSSNIYDNREWHNLKGDGCPDAAKPKKRGRLLKKLGSNERPLETNHVPSDLCKCEQHESNSSDIEPTPRPLDFNTNGLKNAFDKRTSLSPEDISVTCGQQLTSNRLSPNVDSAGHVQLTRVVGSGRARATANCDVSPHRLLTRRNNSPNGRSSGMDAKSMTISSEERQRSHSWSNGKLGTKANFKTSSLTVRPSNPVRITKASSPQLAAKTPSTSITSAPKTPSKPPKVESHSPECPLHFKSEDVPTISVSKAHTQGEFDDDLPPMLRRRAASESQTLRPRRLLPRTPDSCDQIQEHAHVRWADEERGSSLSTSVFLSSIRPRSYSYGAMDIVPNRPILKKVPGF